MTSTSPLPAGSCPGSAGRQPRWLFPFAFVFFFLLGRETVYEQSRRDNCSVQPLKLLPLAHDAALRKAKSYWVLTLVENLVFLERDSAMVLVDVDRVASCLRAGRAPPQPRAVTTSRRTHRGTDSNRWHPAVPTVAGSALHTGPGEGAATTAVTRPLRTFGSCFRPHDGLTGKRRGNSPRPLGLLPYL